MTWRELQQEIGKNDLDDIVGGWGLEAGLDESGKTLDDQLYDCRALRGIIYTLEHDTAKRPLLLNKLRSVK